MTLDQYEQPYQYVQPLSTLVYFLIGVLIGVAAVFGTAVLVILCANKHKKTDTNENGFEIQTQANRRPIAEICHASNPNTYLKSKPMVASVPRACASQNKPPASQQMTASISSDYTESHYYTEIDEYFINKRKLKEQRKLQHRNEASNEAFDEHPVAANVLQLENSSYEYDYVYGQKPSK